jgi:type IV pilus assembly protein PilB
VSLPAGEAERFLQGSALFQGVEPAVVQKTAAYFKAKAYPAGALIAQAGRPADKLGIIQSGTAIEQGVDAVSGDTQDLETLRPGDLVCEIGALLEGAHPRTIKAASECTILEIPNEILVQLSRKAAGVGHALARKLATRIVKQSLLAKRPAAAPAPQPSQPLPSESTPGGIPFVEVSDFRPSDQLLDLVPGRLMREHKLIPLEQRGQKLLVGMVSPKNRAAIAELQRVLQSVDIEVAAISIDDFSSSLIRLKPGAKSALKKQSAAAVAENISFDHDDSEREADKEVRVIGEEVVRVVSRIIAEGLRRHASDIHVEADRAGVRVRYRVAGMLEEWNETVPPSFAKGIVARIKVLAGLDITEKRLPQDGRLGFTVNRQEVDLRISTIPAARGEKVVMRICEAGSVLRPLEQTFIERRTLDAARRAINLKTGAIIVAGGTGSGKSSTVYSMLNERQRIRPDSNIVTVEDPIEFRLPGITQVQVNAPIGLTFAQVLRATLRQDPDVIVVGETRDPDTAHMAMEASISGHLLLTSIHANDSTAVIQRLETLGCSRSLVAQALSLVLVQRLAPKLCAKCRSTGVPPPMMARSLEAAGLIDKGASTEVPIAGHCDLCDGSGHEGRVALIESLLLDDELKGSLMAGANLGDIAKSARTRGIWSPFEVCARQLMHLRLLGAADALLTVAR